MALNTSKGNMYDFVTHTWNAIKGECYHNCSYCYMDAIRKRFKKECKPSYLDEGELKTNLGKGNFIFVGSSCDMFAKDIPHGWILEILDYCYRYDNRYLFQSKNPARILDYITHPIFSKKAVICTTIESDSFYPEIMRNSPEPMQRSIAMQQISEWGVPAYVTIEPVIDFHLEHFVKMVKRCNPVQVNIGADSGNHHLPEPSREKILGLIGELQGFTAINRKTNIQRILK